MVVLEAVFDKVDVFADVGFAAGFIWQERLDDVLDTLGPISPDRLASMRSRRRAGHRAAFIERQMEVAQRLFDFVLGGFAPGFGQLRGKLLG